MIWQMERSKSFLGKDINTYLCSVLKLDIDMTTVIVSIENGANTKSIAAAMRQLKGVVKVKVQKDSTFERIPGLAYTPEERLKSISNAEENIRSGKLFSANEVRAMFP